jgi:hypothetical protein
MAEVASLKLFVTGAENFLDSRSIAIKIEAMAFAILQMP